MVGYVFLAKNCSHFWGREDFSPNLTTAPIFSDGLGTQLPTPKNSQIVSLNETNRFTKVYFTPSPGPNATRSIPKKIPGFPTHSNPRVVHELQRIPADLFVERRLNRQKKHRDSVRRISHGNEIWVLRGSGYLGVVVSWVISTHFWGLFFKHQQLTGIIV